MIGLRPASGAAIALVLAGCAGDEPPPYTPPPAAPAPHRPAAPARDECGAAEAQALVGKPRSEIPVPVIPSQQRVACTTCPVTQDYNPRRLNFFFDADTGVVREVRCG
jgi:hypothetical protein